MSKKLDVQGILTEARSDIECIVMAARQLPPEEGGPIAAMADAVGKKIEKALRLSTAETNCARWRRESVPVWLREKGFEAPVYGCVFVST
jgi:hypothetical protein